MIVRAEAGDARKKIALLENPASVSFYRHRSRFFGDSSFTLADE
jgi:hypothetical protein